LIPMSTDVWSREFSHTVGDNGCQLHHMLIQFCVFPNVELNAISVGLQLLVQRHEFADETLNFAPRCLR